MERFLLAYSFSGLSLKSCCFWSAALQHIIVGGIVEEVAHLMQTGKQRERQEGARVTVCLSRSYPQ